MIIGHKLLNFSSQVDITKQVCLPSCKYIKKGHMLLLHTKISLRGKRLKGKGREFWVREKGERGGREGNACEETIVFLVFNIHRANVKILIGPSSKHVNHNLHTLIRLAEINITLLSN